MSGGEPPSDPTLASDADREFICTRLQEACVHGRLTMEELSDRVEKALAARTRGELLVLVRDLPPDRFSPGPALPPAPARRWHVALVGSNRRAGRWRIPAESYWASMLGGCRLDLTRAQFEAPVTTINIATGLGGVEVRVPKGFEVQIEGMAVMGGKRLRLDGPPPPPGAPVIRIRVVSGMGGVKVTDRETFRARLRQ